jgi:hypothetical protein
MKIAGFSLLYIFLLFSGKSFSQGIIEGIIKDVDTKSPINGATINLNSANRGDNTDAFGTFRFTDLTAGQYELIASHIGYRTEIIPVEVKDKMVSTINASLRKGNLDLSEIRLNSKKNYGLNEIGQLDIMLRPVNTSQDVLRIVPGVFIAQHAGGGKAEQVFLRGFDIDHGTDISLTVDGRVMRTCTSSFLKRSKGFLLKWDLTMRPKAILPQRALSTSARVSFFQIIY